MAKSDSSEDAEAMDFLLAALPPPGEGPSGPCPSTDQLGGFALGRLLPEERETAERHVALCPSCREVVVALSEEPAFGAEAPARTGSGSGRTLRWRPWAAAAAAVVLVFVGFRVLTGPDQPEPPPSDTGAAMAEAARDLVRGDPALFAGFTPLTSAERNADMWPVERAVGAVALIAPFGKVLEAPAELVWTAVPGAESYEIVIRDLRDPVGRQPWKIPSVPAGIVTGDLARVRVVLEPPPVPGSGYLWKVSAAGATGEVQATATFSVATPAEADRLARAASAIDAGSPAALAALLKAHFALRLGFLSESERHARAFVASHPDDAVARETLYAVLNRIRSPEAPRWRF